jgi:hypothetical protein
LEGQLTPLTGDLPTLIVVLWDALIMQDRPLRLLMFGDNCSGVPGEVAERNLRALVAAILAQSSTVDALCYLGDHIAGYTASENALRGQWNHFLRHEFRSISKRFPRIYHLPSNHTAYDRMSSAIYESHLSPKRHVGLIRRKGLNYAVRQGRSLLVFLNTADPDNQGAATLDVEWLYEALTADESASIKLVFGHHPIHPVNGYMRAPLWCVSRELGARAWSLLRLFAVKAYICSHILAFDFQVHDDVVQLCSGGGGTVYGPGGLMPAFAEYHHFLECEVSESSLRCDTYDVANRLRESVTWPVRFQASPAPSRRIASDAPMSLPAPAGWLNAAATRARFTLAIEAQGLPEGREQPLLEGWTEAEGPPVLWVGLEGSPPRLVVKAIPVPGEGQQTWLGSEISPDRPFVVTLAFCPEAGPGGVMAKNADGTWSSLATSGARGLARMAWPEAWMGHCSAVLMATA